MGQVTVTIAGKVYRMSCGDGEEAHLEALAALYDSRIEDMRKGLGELGDMRLHVMAALTLADEMSEMKGRVERMEQQLEALRGDAGSAETRAEQTERLAAAAIVQAAERIGRVARAISPQPAH
ncbi:MAG: cell division protein ZapA [Hyphomicrobiales bacterium]|nr:cell division protein ZapA [Hyphomicrobiales bacterium]